MPSRSDDISKLTNKTIITGAVTNVFLAVVKIVSGVLGNSHALIADGIHSSSDLITDGIVYVAARFGQQDADQEHPYGHKKIETLAVTIISCCLILVALGIIHNGAVALAVKEKEMPQSPVLLISILSIIINEWLYRYTAINARILKMEVLMANAWHHRSDAASSVVVTLGILGTLLGFEYLDAIAAMVVGLMIIKIAMQLGWFSLKELIDTSIEKELLDKIAECMLGVEGVVSIHQLRGRSMSRDILLDCHIIVEPYISVSEGHYIGQQVKLRILRKFAEIVDVTIHIDPEDDEFVKNSNNIKSRSTILADLSKYSVDLPFYNNINKIILHYVDSKIVLDIYFKHEDPTKEFIIDKVSEDYLTVLSDLVYIKNINIYSM